jgi:exopolysaccharide biosynthesis protein
MLTLLIALLLAPATGPAEPVVVTPMVWQTPDGEARGMAAVVDLSAVEVIVSGGDERTAAEQTVMPEDTFAFARRTGSALAVNANFYGWVEGRLDPIGLVLSDGVTASVAREAGGQFGPMVLFDDGEGEAIVYAGPTSRPADFQATDAVAGVGVSGDGQSPGTLLALDGQNLGTTARVAPDKRHPRTALGVSADGRTLYLLVVDGRQPGHSVGMTLPELADAMIALGADDALNLDGGGSTAMVYARPDGTLQSNRPSDGDFRTVSTSVGFVVRVPSHDGRSN